MWTVGCVLGCWQSGCKVGDAAAGGTADRHLKLIHSFCCWLNYDLRRV